MSQDAAAEILYCLAKSVDYIWHPDARIRRLIQGIAEDMRAVAKCSRDA